MAWWLTLTMYVGWCNNSSPCRRVCNIAIYIDDDDDESSTITTDDECLRYRWLTQWVSHMHMHVSDHSHDENSHFWKWVTVTLLLWLQWFGWIQQICRIWHGIVLLDSNVIIIHTCSITIIWMMTELNIIGESLTSWHKTVCCVFTRSYPSVSSITANLYIFHHQCSEDARCFGDVARLEGTCFKIKHWVRLPRTFLIYTCLMHYWFNYIV